MTSIFIISDSLIQAEIDGKKSSLQQNVNECNPTLFLPRTAKSYVLVGKPVVSGVIALLYVSGKSINYLCSLPASRLLL